MAKLKQSRKAKTQERKKHSKSEEQTAERSEISEEMIDKTLEDSFPASDPPSWTTGRERSTSQRKISRIRRGICNHRQVRNVLR